MPERGLAAPQIGRAQEFLGDGDEIRLPCLDRHARCTAGRCQPIGGDGETLVLPRDGEPRPIGSAIAGGNLMSGPGKPSVRGTATLWVGARPALPSALADIQPT